MRELTESSVVDYLRAEGRVAGDTQVRARRLAGGVSNEVIRIEVAGGDDFVIKQVRGQLRTEAEWLCTIERIWREADFLARCGELLPAGNVPQLLFEDRQNYAIAMTAAPSSHAVWKQVLLSGVTDTAIAVRCGELLSALHGGSWQNEFDAERFADRSIFDNLRLDPYYRFTASRCGEGGEFFRRLITENEHQSWSLVHADFSPKNLLVWYEDKTLRTLLVDYETGHFGDPAFDLGFFMSHLALKAVHRPAAAQSMWQLAEVFWERYEATMRPMIGDSAFADLLRRGAAHLAGCAWARIDGKSPAEYLSETREREAIRSLCRGLARESVDDWDEIGRRVLATAGALEIESR